MTEDQIVSMKNRPLTRSCYSREYIFQILDSNILTSWFQPIYSRKTRSVYGFEALARLITQDPEQNIGELFKSAQHVGLISSLDLLCREKAFCKAVDLGFQGTDTYLFVNICPATLMNQNYQQGLTNGLAEACGIDKENIVLEITEQDAIRNYDLFNELVSHYRSLGYKIALDDFGAGYSGLKMLSIIEPDFVKIDRHFISDIHKDSYKFNLVDAIATVCHKLGITVIAEGVEQEKELKAVLSFGIDLVQGYLLEKPRPDLIFNEYEFDSLSQESVILNNTIVPSSTIGDICEKTTPLSALNSAIDAHELFAENASLYGIPIVENERLIGMLYRRCLTGIQPDKNPGSLEDKTTLDILEPDVLLVEATTPLEEVVHLTNIRKVESLYDDICISKNGKYYGTVTVSKLLETINRKNIQLAKSTNPLTGLPGTEFIQRSVTKLLKQNVDFDISFIDIDNFHSYNCHYGFENGDNTLQLIAKILSDIVQVSNNNGFRIAGHIGGDSFVIISQPHTLSQLCEKFVEDFHELLPKLHGEKDYNQGYYEAADRRGEVTKHPLLSLSIGIVNTMSCRIESYGELAHLATGVKKYAKKHEGSVIVKNRRERARSIKVKEISLKDNDLSLQFMAADKN